MTLELIMSQFGIILNIGKNSILTRILPLDLCMHLSMSKLFMAQRGV